MTIITSTQNQRVKSAIRMRHHRDRVEQQRFVIDGLREIAHALAGHVHFLELFVCQSHCNRDGMALQERMEAAGVTVHFVTERVWEKLTFGNRRDGILAVAQTPNRDLHVLGGDTGGLIVVLEGLEKPGNVGAIIRTADGAGARAVIVADGVSDLFNPNVIRASLGTIFRLPVVASTGQSAVTWLREHRFRIFVATVDGSQIYSHCDFTGPTALVLGSEAQGVTNTWKARDLTAVQLPMRGHADSLNVSAAAAILLYEAQRQRD